ncbi:MAG: hypothetical protein ACKPH7_29120, partial [Planktothrix sp.]|uniref:hypothetical protein n=1 Tax=Planktothrix sp. TaxID=3088171 RepID=UPI0038D35992
MTTKPKMGRPSKLTPAIKNRLLGLIRIGTPLETACRVCGLDYNTVRDWISRGENRHPTRPPNPEYVDFAVGYNQVVGEAETILINRIHEATKHDWKAAAWLLARRHPDRWSESKPTSLEDVIVSMAQSGLLSSDQLDAL